MNLDDAYVAPLHAALEVTRDGRLLVSDLGSVNGIVIGGKRMHDLQSRELADNVLQIGHTRLRVRTASETLAPEKPDRIEPISLMRHPALIAGIGGAACLIQLAYSAWLGAPRDLATTVVTTLLSALFGGSVWVAFWALLSRVMQGEWRWLRHAAILLGVAAVFVTLDGLLELGWFVFSLPQWGVRTALVGAVAFGCALYFHLMYASSLSTRGAMFIACLIPALSGGAGQWLQERYQIRDVNHISTSLRIYPPALRLRAAGTVDDYFRATADLRADSDRKRKAMVDSESDEAEDL